MTQLEGYFKFQLHIIAPSLSDLHFAVILLWTHCTSGLDGKCNNVCIVQ